MINRNRVCVSTILLAACLVGMPKAQAQSEQEPSVAEAARKAREQKKTQAKPSMVITNDTLKPATPATVQQAAAADSTPATDATAAAGATPAATPSGEAKAGTENAAQPAKGPTEEEIAKKKAKIEALKQAVADKKKEVDLQQRALALANESYYSRPDFSKDTDGKAKLDGMQNDLAQKKDELSQLEAKLRDLAPEADLKPAPPQQ